MSKKFFCVVPWKELYVTPSGTYRLCCHEDSSAQRQAFQTTITDGIQSHWNSDYMKQSRRDFLDNKLHRACGLCWVDELNGRTSMRQRKNIQYLGEAAQDLDSVIEQYQTITQDDGTTDIAFTGINLATGNVCQLRCVHCSPTYSNSVAKDYAKMGWDQNFKNRKYISITETRQTKLNVDIWQQLKSVAHEFTQIYCTGGEPTISIDLLDFLRWLISQELAKNISLVFNTNGVSLRKPFLEAVQQFKSCSFSVSVDATGPVDHYIRFPTDWQRRQNNIQHLMDLFPGKVKLFTSIHAMSISDYPNLLEQTRKLDLVHDHVMVSYPESLDIRHMPLEFKQQMIARLESCVDHSKGFLWNNGITSAINRLKMTRDEDRWQQARQIIHSYDNIRPYTLASVQPELAPYLV